MTVSANPLLPPEAEDRLEDAIKSVFAGRELDIYQMMLWQLGYSDDRQTDSVVRTERRLHGSLLLAVSQVLHGDYSVALRYAVPVELMHNFAMIHADVQDGNTERLGRASIWWKWGPAQAINTGDGMHAMARLSLFELCDKGEPLQKVSAAVEIVDDAVMQRCEGEYLDLTFQERPAVTVAEYLDMVKQRVGSLYGASAELASIVTGDLGMERRLALRRFGECVGVLKQLTADYRSFFGGEDRDPVEQGRIISKKKNIALAYLFDVVKDPSILRRAGEMYMQRVVDPSRISELIEMSEDAGAREFNVQQIESQLSAAEKALSDAGLSGDLMLFAHEISDIGQVAPFLQTED